MTHHSAGAPELMPVLSRGKHRTPRNGGCFMEFASYLAGESWSDHPACTHPALASLARMVNDCTSDAARSRLTSLIPSVIGLRGDDPRVGLLVALRAATEALPVASMERQRALAVGILTCERNLAGLDDSSSAGVTSLVRRAFEQAPDTERWARDFIGFVGSRPRSKFTAQTAESILRISVPGIAEACVPDADARLYDLLAQAIEDCTRILAAPEAARSAPVPVLR
ncbi:hypothetical protein [Cryobacterium tagatosivorans]|nr:hypothetical protein [Cryobacterium tagatosivorans]